MTTETAVGVDERRALEALRNGVPNRDAVAVLGCSQEEVERRFRAQLAEVEVALQEGRGAPGLLIEGGFGSGKSHLLEYLQHVALSEGFVVSRVVISKETPLYDSIKLFRAAVETAVVPGLRGQAIPEIAARLDADSLDYAELYKWSMSEEGGLGALFPATLFLHERLKNDPELVEAITGFWGGDQLALSAVRQGLRQIGAASAFSLRAIQGRELAMQRFRFASRLMRGAGFKGWVVLIDEVELMGRYSLLQRGRSYAELARWMGQAEGEKYGAITAVAAITDDFALAVVQQKNDRDYIGARLRSRGTDEFMILAARADTGIRLIEREAVPLAPPNQTVLLQTYLHLKRAHGVAYHWEPPDVEAAEWSVRRAMRSYVRRWINEWDLKRLYPGAMVSTVEEELHTTYVEDQDLERSEEPPSETFGDGFDAGSVRSRADELEPGLAAYLRYVEEPSGNGLRAALFFLTAHGEPVEFSFSRVDHPTTVLWRPGEARRKAVGSLARALFEATPKEPSLLLALADEAPPGLFTDELEVRVPTCRVAGASPGSLGAHESLEVLADARHVFWVGASPAPDSSARQLFDALLARNLLLEPFERAALGLEEAYRQP